jgi:hypothetical protein
MIVARVLFLDALGPRRKPINAVTSFFPAPLPSGDRFGNFRAGRLEAKGADERLPSS